MERWGRSRQGRDLRLWGLGLWLGGRSCASRVNSLTPQGVSYRCCRCGLRLGTCGLLWSGGGVGFGGGREEIVVVASDGVADGSAPGIGAESLTILVLGDVDRLHERLGQVGDGAGGSGFYIAADNGGDEASQGGAEIAGGEVVAGKEVGQVFAERLSSVGAGFFLGVIEAEVGILPVRGVWIERRPPAWLSIKNFFPEATNILDRIDTSNEARCTRWY